MPICEKCQETLPTLSTRLRKVNYELWTLGFKYHRLLPVNEIDSTLERYGFHVSSVWRFRGGDEAKVHEEVGEGKWLSFSAHRMESGNWEVVAYVN